MRSYVSLCVLIGPYTVGANTSLCVPMFFLCPYGSL